MTATSVGGQSATVSFGYTITNVAPAPVAITAPSIVDACAAANYTFTVADVSSADQAAGFAWQLDYGDGTTETMPAGTASPLARAHTFANPGVYTVTARATDKDGGVSALASQPITIRNTTPPGVTPHSSYGPILGTSPAGAVVFYEPATATGYGSLNFTCSKASGTFFPLGTTTVTYTATDSDGHSASGNFTVTVIDQDAPSLTLHATDVTVEAAGPAGAVVECDTSVETTDNVTASPVVTWSKASGTVFPLGLTTVTATVSDEAGNTRTRSFTVLVQDTVAPIIAPMPNVVAEVNNISGAYVNYPAPVITDAASGVEYVSASKGSGELFRLGETVVTVIARDQWGNTAVGSFTVLVRDTTAPVLTVPDSVTVEASSAAGANVTYAPGRAYDALDGICDVTYTQASGTNFPLGTTVVTMTSRDSRGNTAVGSFTVTVRDSLAPSVARPSDITVEFTSAAGAVVTYPAITANDSVTASPTVTYSTLSGSLFPLGETVVTITATDEAHNSNSTSFKVTVRDTTAPEVSHEMLTVEATRPDGAIVNYAPAHTFDWVTANPTVTYSQASGTLFSMGATLVHMYASDEAGNTKYSSFMVIVQDTVGPVITHPDVTVEATSPAGATVTYDAATAVDAVSGPASFIGYSPLSGSVFPVGINLMTMGASDAAHHESIATFKVTVQDTTPPHVTVPPNIRVTTASTNGAKVNFAVSATDLVDGAIVPTVDYASGSTFLPGVTTVTATATDSHGNAGTASFTVTVSNGPPQISVDSNGTAPVFSSVLSLHGHRELQLYGDQCASRRGDGCFGDWRGRHAGELHFHRSRSR